MRKVSRRVGIALAVTGAAVAAGGVYATSLSITTGQAQGNKADLAVGCQTGALTITPNNIAYNATDNQYEFTEVLVAGFTEGVGGKKACDGKTIKVTVYNAGGTALGSKSIAVDSATDLDQVVSLTDFPVLAGVAVNAAAGYASSIDGTNS